MVTSEARQTLWVERSNRPRAKSCSFDFCLGGIPGWVDRWIPTAKSGLDKWQEPIFSESRIQNPAYRLALFSLLYAMPKILIIDDERFIRASLREILEYEKFEVTEAQDGEEGLAKIQEEDFDLVLCDVKMPKMDGIEVLDHAKAMERSPQFIMISAHGSIETAVEATKKGAFDFIPKPPDLNRLLLTVRNALDKKQLVTETKVLKKNLSKKFDMVGESPAIERVKDSIEKVAPRDARVLITGPNGTGKELVAHWIH